MSSRWTADQIPDQTGRTAVVTGANSGLGLETARELARKGARVVLACRNAEKGAAAAKDVESCAPGADVMLAALDLGSLDSVRAFADRFKSEHGGADLLINNAGVMAVASRQVTADGFEMQFGTNHLGHFALTALLIGAMRDRNDARVVNVSSGAHRMGRMNFDDLHGEQKYGRWAAYGQSKLSNLLFTFELDRRLRAAGSSIKSVAAHPGYSATHLQSAAAPALDKFVMSIGNAVLAQSAEKGALPTLYAATAPDVQGGEYFGPDGFMEQRGYPKRVGTTEHAKNEEDARKLWEVSEQLTGFKFDVAAAAPPVEA
jgi:NAD(P)-dependent dehydrogenase (short-subunit alcohol dehydrogenase family)